MRFDLNADLGEGFKGDSELLKVVSSANIACGGHAGNRVTINRTIELAKINDVHVGAHPGFVDPDNFGRVPMALDYAELREHILPQLIQIKEVCAVQGVNLHHIKAHGALYNQISIEQGIAESYLQIINEFSPSVILYAMAGSIFSRLAKQYGFIVWEEGFADRRYLNSQTLVARSKPGAVMNDINEVIDQVKLLVEFKQVQCENQQRSALSIDTLCVHGDTPDALEMARAIQQKFNC